VRGIRIDILPFDTPSRGECLELVVSLLQIIDKFFKFDRVRQNLFGCRLQFINIGQFNLG
jgi:hypothetical protein